MDLFILIIVGVVGIVVGIIASAILDKLNGRK